MDDLITRAELNDRQAQSELALAYFIGNGVSKDIGSGAKWFVQASKEPDTLKKAINVDGLSKHPDSCFRIYELWKSLRPTSRENSIIANRFLIAAAQGGIAQAQHLLAIECLQGDLLPSEYSGNEHAVFWHTKSLENEHPEAHRNLALLYTNKNKYPDTYDSKKAFYHMAKIVEQGERYITGQYGMAYVKGEGVKQNLVEGVKWMFISKCQLTDFRKMDDIKSAVDMLSPEEFKQARKSAIDWIKANALSAPKFSIPSKFLGDPLTGETLEIELDNESQPTTVSKVDLDNEVTAEVIHKWHDYIAGSTEVTDDDVYTLLMEGASDAQLADIFQYYDNKDELITRYKTARKPGIADTNIESIAKAAKADLLFKYRLCLESKNASRYKYFTDELSEEQIENSTVRHVDEDEFDEKRAYIFYEAVNEIITDELDHYKVPGSMGLDEALIGALQDYDLKNHVL